MNFDVEIDQQTNIALTAGLAKLSVTRLTIKGTLCLCFRPFLTIMPIVGGKQIYFVKVPEIEFEFAGVGHVVELPIIATLFRNEIRKRITAALVLPNVLFIPFTSNPKANLDRTTLRSPRPRGYLCLQVHGCSGLFAPGWTRIASPCQPV